jgi:hypothetical protein
MVVPLVVGAVAMFTSRGRVTWKEFLAMEALCLFLLGAGVFIARWTATYDVEVWSGRIVSKKKDWVSCEHSYSCNCRTTGSGKKKSTTCDTCYEHSNDWDWLLFTSNGERVEIERIDRRGSQTPPRWEAAKVGDATAITHAFDNYIKANPDSVLRLSGTMEAYSLPEYPNTVYDYYYVNRVVGDAPVPNRQMWEWQVAELNADLGRAKQVNVVFVFTKQDPGFTEALREKWIGGKKNDLIIIFGTKDGTFLDWVNIISWTDSEMLKVQLRDELLAIKDLGYRGPILDTVKRMVKEQFVRKPMADFKYLMAGLQPGPGAIGALFFLSIALSCGLVFWFHKEDVFGDEDVPAAWRRRV